MNSYFAHRTAVLDEGVKIGEGTRIWHFSHIMTGAVIGRDCNLGQNVMIAGKVVLGDHVKVQNNVSVFSGVTCEDEVFIGPSVVFTNIKNPRSAISRSDSFMSTFIRKGATIGANATIICGYEIGEYAMIGAGSVITKSVKAFALVVGNPGRQIGWVSKAGHQLDFNANHIAVCPEKKDKYQLSNEQVYLI